MKRFNTAREAENWINGERWKGEKHGLENTRALLEILGHPERRMGKILHVAGTNGKGSTCAYLSGALTACGFKTGLFTSPHLIDINERFQIDRENVSDARFTGAFNTVMETVREMMAVVAI